MIYYALKSQAEGRRKLGAERPNGPGTGRPERGSVPPPSPCHPTASRSEPCRRATSPRTHPRTPPRGAEPPQDEISPRNGSGNPSRRAARRVRYVRPSPGLSRRPGRGEKRTRSRFLPMPVKISFPCEAREASDTALPLENRDKGSKENRVRPPHRKRKGHTECGVPFSTSWGG